MRSPTEPQLQSFFSSHVVEGVLSAYLFGSHVAGREHRQSDVDVGMVVDRSVYTSRRDRDHLRVTLGADLMRALQRNEVDLVCLQDVPAELGRRVVTEGRRVFCVDPLADMAFVRDVQLRAADLDPFLRKMRALTLQAIRR